MSSTFIKKALLIESSRTTCGDLPGARKDMENWTKHLTSGHGGGWTEILPYSAPSLSMLRYLISEIGRTAHFGFVVFSGHGYYDPKTRTNRIVLNNSEQNVSVEEFRLKSRSITLVDACRGVEGGLVALSAANESVLNKEGVFAGRRALANSQVPGPVEPSLQQYREYFDEETAKITGRALLYSCSVGEAAGEDKNAGGYYTSAILRAARNWHGAVDSGVQTVRAANAAATALMKQRNYQQNPEESYETLGGLLPFAVKPMATQYYSHVFHG